MFLTGALRGLLAARPEAVCSGVRVSNREWEPPAGQPNAKPPARQVIVRDDGIDDGELGTGDVTLGISVLAGTKDNPTDAKQLAAIVKAIVKRLADEAAGPFTVMREFNGPYAVTEAAVWSRQYMTCSLGIVSGL